MTQVLDELVALLSLETIEENLFRGVSQDLGFRQLFGGQVIGQSLSAASQTVAADRHMHSMHAYFLRPGDATQPVVYQVDRVRDQLGRVPSIVPPKWCTAGAAPNRLVVREAIAAGAAQVGPGGR